VQLVSTLHSTRFKKIRRAADPVAAAPAPVSSGASA
jgi:hypothetical protein